MSRHARLEAVVDMTDSIPCAPLILPKLQRLLHGTHATTQELQSLIELDPGLATSVLRMANSAYFGSTSPSKATAGSLEIFVGTRFVWP